MNQNGQDIVKPSLWQHLCGTHRRKRKHLAISGNGFVDVARRPFALCKCAGNIERGPFPHSTGVEVPRISRRQGQVTERAGYWSYQRNPIPKGSAYHLKHYQHSGKVGLWLNLPTKRRSLHRCPEVASSMPCPSFLEIWIIESILQYIGCVE